MHSILLYQITSKLSPLWSIVFFISAMAPLSADVTLPPLFADNMVLQRGKPIEIWGWADVGEAISVTVQENNYDATASSNGKWHFLMDTLPAGGPYTISIEGKNQILLRNVLVGDVWIASGQSNMQWKTKQTPFVETDSSWMRGSTLRLFTVPIEVDYMPRENISGGYWQTLSQESIADFSAVAYHFSKHICQQLEIPIGIINSSLGATSIEAWMSNGSLATFDQFKPEIEPIIQLGKSAKVIEEAFNAMKLTWEKEAYLTGPGMEEEWYLPGTDVTDWKEVNIPGTFSEQMLDEHDGAVWYRKTFDLPDSIIPDSFFLPLTQIDDYDITWVNGVKVGETFGRHNFRNYWIPGHALKEKGNVLVVRVFDTGENGGFTTNAFWMTGMIQGKWKMKAGLKIDAATFQTPIVVNISPFSSPGVLFNANIAPLTKLPVKGIIWYQGESNADRAGEYRSLFKTMINDWRNHWQDNNWGFYFVQLANYGEEPDQPGASTWAELREAQTMALTLPHTGMAVTIDIGEAQDIHPGNKVDVGKRLALAALETSYDHRVVAKGPMYDQVEFKDGKAIISFKEEGSALITKNKYGYVHGFAISGKDQKFYWAQAKIEAGKVIASAKEVSNPVAVRYCWSNNPGVVDLYNEAGLPALPFRTDMWPGITEGKMFDSTNARF